MIETLISENQDFVRAAIVAAAINILDDEHFPIQEVM